jgi:hypothetical protein
MRCVLNTQGLQLLHQPDDSHFTLEINCRGIRCQAGRCSAEGTAKCRGIRCQAGGCSAEGTVKCRGIRCQAGGCSAEGTAKVSRSSEPRDTYPTHSCTVNPHPCRC